MNDDTNLRSTQLAPLWGVSERQSRNILAQLEQNGFTLTVDYYGARQLPRPVAEAVRATRQAGLELASLNERPDLAAYRRLDTAAADECVDLLELRAEVTILREVVGALHRSLSSGSQRYGYAPPSNWAWLGVPDPRRGL